MSKAEEYLKQNVRGILQPMVNAVLSEKPKNPVNFYAYITHVLDPIHDSLAQKICRHRIQWRKHRNDRTRKSAERNQKIQEKVRKRGQGNGSLLRRRGGHKPRRAEENR